MVWEIRNPDWRVVMIYYVLIIGLYEVYKKNIVVFIVSQCPFLLISLSFFFFSITTLLSQQFEEVTPRQGGEVSYWPQNRIRILVYQHGSCNTHRKMLSFCILVIFIIFPVWQWRPSYVLWGYPLAGSHRGLVSSVSAY